jgi:hypothetical protein
MTEYRGERSERENGKWREEKEKKKTEVYGVNGMN